jgi:hyaluronoglucosaminidase
LLPTLGIVEGFFGPLWSWQARVSLLEYLAPRGYTRYVYAPKGDAALRRDWDQPYASTWLDQVRVFSERCRALGVEFGVGVSPYGLQDDPSGARLHALREQLLTLRDLGVERIALLFDDMPTQTDFLAVSQLRIVDAATQALPSMRFALCPSYYSDDIVLDRVFGERPPDYLPTLGRSLDPSIEVFWTGPEVCARQISGVHLDRIAETLRRRPTLWDNYPVNDGPRMSTQLHLRGFTGRDAANRDKIVAHLINPALQPTLSAIPALTLIDVYREGERYDYMDSFFDASKSVVGEALALALREDILTFQDTGLHRLGNRIDSLQAKYAAIDHPAAQEVLAWLRGRYAVSAELVQTQ